MKSWEYIGELERPLVVSQDNVPDSVRDAGLLSAVPVAAGLPLGAPAQTPGATLWLGGPRLGFGHDIYARLKERQRQARSALPKAISEVQRVLQQSSLKGKLSARVKEFSSAVQKMMSENLDPDGLEDLLGIRIIVPGIADCYSVLDALHDQFAHRPGSLDDYVVRPKSNGYQSLHSCLVLPPDGVAAEVQIRSVDMHAHAEQGAAQHLDYKRFRYPAF